VVFLKLLVAIITLNTLVFAVRSDGDISSQINYEINNDIAKLEIDIANGLDASIIKKRIDYIDNSLWNWRVNTYNQADENNDHWNESELLILDAKKRLDSLSDKLKLEGDWGKISLSYNPVRQIKPNIRYLLPF